MAFPHAPPLLLCSGMSLLMLLLSSLGQKGAGLLPPCGIAQGSPAIIDTDIGTFLDDTFALAFALELQELDVRLVVTASHDTTGRARVAAKHLTLAGVDHVPIGIGVATSNETGALFSWADDFDLTGYPGGVHEDGVKAMLETIQSCSGSGRTVALIEIGPHTNVMWLLRRFPEVRSLVRVFVMGGSVVPGIRLPWGHVTPVNTTNEKIDPSSARAMLHTRWAQPVQFAPIATTYQVVLSGRLWQELRLSDRRSVQVLMDCYAHWWKESRQDPAWITHAEALTLDPSRESAILFDAEAVHLAAMGRWLTLTELIVDFSDYGHTIILPANSSSGSLALFALNWTKDAMGTGNQSGLDLFCQYLTSVLLTSTHDGVSSSTDTMQNLDLQI